MSREHADTQPESHRSLAELREKQKRLEEAIEQWRQVVRTKAFEPAGWLSLARVQAQARRVDDARKTLDQVIRTQWDPKYGSVREDAARMLATLGASPGR